MEKDKLAGLSNYDDTAITTAIILAFLKSRVSFSIGGTKYKTAKPLKAKIFVSPERKVEDAPYPKIGKILWIVRFGITEEKEISKLTIIMIHNTTLAFIILLFPKKLAIMLTKMKNANR